MSCALRPSPGNTLIDVTIGDETLVAECWIIGRFRAAVTQADPEYCYPAESPEVEILRLWLDNTWRNVSGLLDDGYIADTVQEQCDEWVCERANDGSDPDELRERDQEYAR